MILKRRAKIFCSSTNRFLRMLLKYIFNSITYAMRTSFNSSYKIEKPFFSLYFYSCLKKGLLYIFLRSKEASCIYSGEWENTFFARRTPRDTFHTATILRQNCDEKRGEAFQRKGWVRVCNGICYLIAPHDNYILFCCCLSYRFFSA